MVADDPRVILAEMAERERKVAMGHVRDPEDVPRLLAAVGAVLRLAEAAIPVLEALGGCAGHDGEFRPGCDCADGLPTAWTLDPEAVRSAILAALTGKDGTDG